MSRKHALPSYPRAMAIYTYVTFYNLRGKKSYSVKKILHYKGAYVYAFDSVD